MLSKRASSTSSLARDDQRWRGLMSTPGVGAIVALTYVPAIDVRAVAIIEDGGSAFWPPKKYQSSETNVTGQISKLGDEGMRPVHYEAANVIAIRLAAHIGMREAKVTLGCKLAVVLHRMLVDSTAFIADRAATAEGINSQQRSDRRWCDDRRRGPENNLHRVSLVHRHVICGVHRPRHFLTAFDPQ
jgi:transposase